MIYPPIRDDQGKKTNETIELSQLAQQYVSRMSSEEISSTNLLKELGTPGFVKRLLSGDVDRCRTLIEPLCEYFVILWKAFPSFKAETIGSLSFANDGYIIHQLYTLIIKFPRINSFRETSRSIDLLGNNL